jgi:hypothetical protein
MTFGGNFENRVEEGMVCEEGGKCGVGGLWGGWTEQKLTKSDTENCFTSFELSNRLMFGRICDSAVFKESL